MLRAATAAGTAVRIGADLDAGGMARVLEHEAGDLTCTVEAGIRLSELAAALLSSQLVPSAIDILHPGRVAVLFEGGAAAVAAQVAAMRSLVGGDEANTSVWSESRSRQAAAAGRTTFDPGSLRDILGGHQEAVIRPSAGVAFLPTPVADTTSAAVRSLQERVRARFDPAGVLAEASA